MIGTMAQIIRCPHCQKAMQLPDNALGKKMACPTCKQPFMAPSAIPVAPATTKPTNGNGSSGQLPALPPQNCPSCGTKLLDGAVACMDCGYLLKNDSATSIEGLPNLCPNPACGVANPVGERYCQRCNNPLPIAGGTLLHGRYRLDKLLKMGGFGAVYMATDTKVDSRAVAIKDMIGNDPQEFAIRLNFFRREAEILRTLEKVPIVPLFYDFINQGHTAHLVMEFIRGKDLLDLMEQINHNKPFPVPMIVEWSKAICDVL